MNRAARTFTIPACLALATTLAVHGAALADDDEEELQGAKLHSEILDGARAWSTSSFSFDVKNWKVRKAEPARWPNGKTNPIMTQEMWTGGENKVGAKPYDTIVIHETGSPRGFARLDVGVHFLVDGDATIYQLGDLAKRFDHGSNGVINRKSIGIETAVGAGGMNIFTSGGPGRVQVKWIGAYNRWLALPSEDQCKSEYELVSFLLDKYPTIPRRVLNASIAPGYFILSSNTKALKPEPSGSAVLEPVEVGGIVSHSIIKQHVDGSALAAYLWLRIEKEFGHDDAYEVMKAIVALPPIKVVDHKDVRARMAPDMWSMVTVVDPYATGKLGERPDADSTASTDEPAPSHTEQPTARPPSAWSTDEEDTGASDSKDSKDADDSGSGSGSGDSGSSDDSGSSGDSGSGDSGASDDE